MEKKRPKALLWFLVLGLGLVGQICWNMENQWFNTFVYAKIAKDPSIITGMLSFSALATTFSTFFFGTLSDRLGKRRLFISLGYILWGIFTIVFGLTQYISKEAYVFLGVMVVLADTVMSFFGSMGNDSGFSTWCNDIMTKENRGGLGAALAILPIVGTVVGTVVGGFLVGENDNYMRLFVAIGSFVIFFGLLSMVMLNKGDDVTPNKDGTFWHQFFSVFNFKEFFRYRELVLVHCGLSLFFIGFNVYFAYLGNYLIYYLGYTPDMMGIIEAVPLLLSALVTIPVGMLIKKEKHPYITICAVLVNAIGCILIHFVDVSAIDSTKIFNPHVWAGVFVVGMGYIALLQTLRVWTFQLYPEDRRGQFEGIWIVFFVLIPMIGGSIIGERVVKSSGEQFLDAASGQMQYIPNGNIFLVGGIVCLLSIIPFVLTIKHRKGA
ncbi:MAG: MFS transporter [Clostridia bacterium]|nr:MFS transporter [Clostridia bacterium]MBQ3897609.1 MFS transporter [Clostridia bacterium]